MMVGWYAAEYDGAAFHGEEAKPNDEHRRSELDKDFGWTLDVFRREDVYGVHETATSRLPQGLIAARRRHATFII